MLYTIVIDPTTRVSLGRDRRWDRQYRFECLVGSTELILMQLMQLIQLIQLRDPQTQPMDSNGFQWKNVWSNQTTDQYQFCRSGRAGHLSCLTTRDSLFHTTSPSFRNRCTFVCCTTYAMLWGQTLDIYCGVDAFEVSSNEWWLYSIGSSLQRYSYVVCAKYSKRSAWR